MSSYASKSQQTDGLFRTLTVIGGNDINKERLFKHGDLQVHGGGVIKKSLFVGCEVIAGCGFTGNLVGDVVGNLYGDVKGNISGNIILSPTGVIAGTYGSASRVPIFTVQTDGRLSFADETQLSLATGVSGVLPATNGGTGLGSYNTGDILYASSPTTLAGLPDVPTGNVLKSGGIGVAPVYGQVDLANDVTGILSVLNGGYIPPTNVLIVRKNPGPLEYLTITAALAAAVGPSTTNRYTIYIHNGDYVEPPLGVPDYVFVVGQSMQNVRITPSALGSPLISFSKNSGLAFVTIFDTDPAFPALWSVNYCNLVLHKVAFENCSKGILCTINGLAIQPGCGRFEYLNFTTSTHYAIQCNDTNLLGGYGQDVSVENLMTQGHCNDAVIVDGLNSCLKLRNGMMVSDGGGNAFTLSNGGILFCHSVTLMDWFKGFYVPVAPGTPKLNITSMHFIPSTTPGALNFDILNLATTGTYTGWTDYTLTQIPKSCPFSITTEIRQNIITVGIKGAQFTSVVAALAAITGESSTNLYTIEIQPGSYIETQIVLRPYIILQGYNQQQVFLKADISLVGSIFIKAAGASGIYSLTLQADYAFPPLYLAEFEGDASARIFEISDVAFDTSNRCLHQVSVNGTSVMLLDNITILKNTPFQRGLDIECLGPSWHSILFEISNFKWNNVPAAMTNYEHFIYIRSTQSPAPPSFSIVGRITDCISGQISSTPPPIPTFPGYLGWAGIIIDGSCSISMNSLAFSGLSVAMYISNNAEVSYVNASGLSCILGINDIIVDSPIAYGTINGNFRRVRSNFATGSNFAVLILDPEDGVIQTGNLFQGIIWSEHTNISENIQHASSLGFLRDWPSITHVGNLNVEVQNGDGYLILPISDNPLKYVKWTANSSVTLTSNVLSWIYINQNGNVVTSIGSEPNEQQNIILGTVKTYSGNVTYIQEIGYSAKHLATEINDTLRDVFGPIVSAGCIAGPGSSLVKRAVAVSSGFYSFGVIRYPPTSGDNIMMVGYFGGIVEVHTLDQIPLMWDNAGTLTAIAAGKYIKHALYLLSNTDGIPSYYLVYAQEEFASLSDAQNGPLPIPPATFVGNMCPISGIIVTDTDPSSPLASNRFQDIRPTIGFRAGTFSTTTDHNSLTNLTVGDPHTQYLPVNGSRPMTGSLDLGTNAIINSGTINGVIITAHAARHLPGGVDALATAAPVSIGVSNQLGSAASFSRSDHVHQGVYSISGTANQVASSNLFGAVVLSTPSTFIAPGTIKDTSGMHYSTTTAIVATGATQGTATALTTSYNVVTVVAATTGVRLPTPSQTGLIIVVVNRGANALNVYPNVGAQIDLLGVNVAAAVPAGFTATYQASSLAQYYTVSNTISLISGATAGTYGSSTQVGQFTVNAQGQVTFAANVAIGAITVNAGTGLSGGGSAFPGGSVTLTNAGVRSFSAGTTGFLPSSPATGNVVLSGNLSASNGGTGFGSYSTGDLLVGSGSSLTKLGSSLRKVLTTNNSGSGVVDWRNDVHLGNILGNSALEPKLVQFNSTNSAVNYLNISNALTGSGPTVLAAGTDTNIDLTMTTKGTGALNIRGDTNAGAIRLWNAADTFYAGLQAAAMASNITWTWPLVDGVSGNIMSTNGAGVLSFVNPRSIGRQVLPLVLVPVSTTGTAFVAVGYFDWDYVELGAIVSGKLFYNTTITGGKTLEVQVWNETTAAQLGLDSQTISGFYKFTFTLPTANAVLSVRIRKTTGGGANPTVSAASMILNPIS
jgi:hypothetical protein